ncbi:MAG: DUF342 domain-containing protein [Deferribacterales bacterium]
MPVTTLKTLTPHNEHELKKLLEHVYGIEQDWINVTFDDQRLATVEIETEMDIDSRVAVVISEDKMKAEFSLFPAINRGKTLDNNAVENYLIKEKRLSKELFHWDIIKHSIQYYLSGYIVEKVLISEGIPVEDGQDAWMTMHFELDDRRPRELDDGSVDFKDINHIVTAAENELLISYHPETSGRDGTKVTGEKISARRGKKLVIHKGRGIYFDEERQGYAAKEGGYVIFESNRLSVNPIYSVYGDVDYSVGNIKFDGTVSVSGDVLSGFEIHAKNIVVWGIVRDALLTATDDITVKTGVKSTGKCVLKAGRHITAGFIENSGIEATASITIKNYCLNSRLMCEGEITAITGDGTISGGEIRAFSSVHVRRLGLEQGPQFKVFVGVKHSLESKLEAAMADKDKLEQIIRETDEKIRAMAKANPDIKKNPKLKSIITSRTLLMKKYETMDERVDQMIKSSMHPMPFIRIDQSVHDGVTMVFYGTEKNFTETEGSGKFVFNKAAGKIEKLKADAVLENTVTEVKLD